VEGHAPQLVFAEVANALANHVRAGELEGPRAEVVLRYCLSLPLQIKPLETLVVAALTLAQECGLSVYDCCYLALARALDATLVTADRRLAEHHDRVALLA
jgi:predicted nucleic acid-binding protein